MKQIVLAASLGLTLLLTVYCSSDSGNDGNPGFVNPGDFSLKTAYSTAYNTNHQDCSSGHCAAIVFSREIDDTLYSGFAVRDTHEAVGSQDFFIKAWWVGTLSNGSIPMQVIVYDAGNYFAAYTTCSVSFTYPSTGITRVTFDSACTVGGTTLSGTIDGATYAQ